MRMIWAVLFLMLFCLAACVQSSPTRSRGGTAYIPEILVARS